MLTFYRAGTFTIEAFYADASELPAGTNTKIGTFTVSPLSFGLHLPCPDGSALEEHSTLSGRRSAACFADWRARKPAMVYELARPLIKPCSN